MTPTSELAEELRGWAEGNNALAAATELIIRGGFGDHFIRQGGDGRAWIDFANLTEEIGVMSGGQQRYIRIAASIGADEPIVLGDELPGLVRTHAELVIAAVAHAAGFMEPTGDVEYDGEGIAHIVTVPPLYKWPPTQ